MKKDELITILIVTIFISLLAVVEAYTAGWHSGANDAIRYVNCVNNQEASERICHKLYRPR